MKFRILAIAIVVGGSGAVLAQTPVGVQLPADARHQTSVFENSLREAVFRASGDLLKRARQTVPDMELRFQTDIRVQGTWMPDDSGALFLVEVPAIDATSQMLYMVSLRMNQNQTNGVRPAGNGDTRTPVPPVPPPGSGTPVISPMTDPNGEYSEFTRKALVDAMLDNAFALPLKEGQKLMVMAKDATSSPAPTAAIGDPPRRLYLTIKAEDLLALRQTRITRDEARKRIEEKRY